ncbi:hypothetical protein [Portibacter marinus]|uniref:hypothetical protein n=1 Tax=Portibacter marinus TaxID=2898660 RepID=UPI001F387C7C|nr:hypothetical protein [Portibacter marinus]
MKYLIVAVLCLAGIIAISIRETDLTEIAEIPIDIVNNSSNTAEVTGKDELNPEWKEYWYSGVAELSGYDLEQSRYGEIHKGSATMIFVTEPFSRKKQVKLDNPGPAGSDKVSVLKLNFTRNFLTGIYPYSLMTSVFNPVNTDEYQNALKLTMSGQEWCGQVFLQLNKDGGQFDVKSYSYFESEGDEFFSVNGAYLEDELYNLIRFDAGLLPLGEIEIIPSAVVSRLMHQELKPYKAIARLQKTDWRGKEVNVYSLKYSESNRMLRIYFGSEFPRLIEGWEDTYAGYGSEPLTSVAVRKNTIQQDYWNKNSNEFRNLNKKLYQ